MDAAQQMAVVADLALPAEPLGDGSLLVEDLGDSEEGSESSSSGEVEELPDLCAKCGGRLCEASRCQCPQCKIWLHIRGLRAMASSSNRECAFCP